MFKNKTRSFCAVLVTPLLAALALDLADIVLRIINSQPVLDETMVGFFETRLINVYVYIITLSPLCYLLTLLIGIPAMKVLYRHNYLRLWSACLIGIVLAIFIAPIFIATIFFVFAYLKTGNMEFLSFYSNFVIHTLDAYVTFGSTGASVALGVWFIGGITSPSVRHVKLTLD